MVIKVAVVGLGVTVAVGGVVTATVATQAAAATHRISREFSASGAAAPARVDRAVSAPHVARGDVGVTVPRVTFIRVDADGRIVRIWTNSGEIPQRGDRFVILGAGAAHAASTRLVKEILGG